MSRVTLTNPFDLLTDENEDRTNVPTPKKEQKPAAPAAKPAAKPAATGVAAKPAAAKPEGAKAPAKPADAKAAPKAPANNQAVKPAPARDSNSNLLEREKESRPRDRRDRPPTQAGDKKGRTFDRKSGTGRAQNEVKRGGQGKGNWGGEVDPKEGSEVLKEKEEKVADEKEDGEESKEEKVTVEGEKKEGEVKEGEQAAPVPKEEETFTLDEYLAKRKGKSAPKVEALVPRTVNADDFGAAGLVPLQRGEEGIAPFNAKDKKKTEKAEKATEKASGEKKTEKKENIAAKLFKFESHQDSKFKSYGPRSDDRRGGNGSERRQGGGKPRGPPRTEGQANNSNNANAAGAKPPVQEKDFPALGPHGSDPVKA